MKMIKLNAIGSTNTYLKELNGSIPQENYTVVTADEQSSGRGQMGSVWESEKGKNLTFSVLVKVDKLLISRQFYLNMVISISVIEMLKSYADLTLHIKWPNDILADGKKIAGILIENQLQQGFIKSSVVGIGVNINQQSFSKLLVNVTSLSLLTKKQFNLDKLLIELVEVIKKNVALLEQDRFAELKSDYLKLLYKRNIPAMFVDEVSAEKKMFIGKISGVSEEGKLQVLLENDKLREFNLKEIKFAELSV